ncbi:MAG: biopolymer transporter ExbD [Gemmatimonadaceae bacterium]
MNRGASGGITSEPNVIPMIDVMLVLIVTFMLLIRVRLAYDLQVPAPATAGNGASIVIGVDSGPMYSVNGASVPLSELQSSLHSLLSNGNDRTLFVRGARTAKYQDVIAAFDAARGAGAVVTGIVPSNPASARSESRIRAGGAPEGVQSSRGSLTPH